MSVVRPLALRPSVAHLALALALVAPRAGSAQPAAQESLAPATTSAAPTPVPAPAPGDSGTAAPRGPTQDAARVGVERATERGPLEANAPRRGGPGFGQSEAMMIVGGAAVVIGLIVGDTAGGVLAFGGAVVGLVGLYQWLR